MEGVADVLSAVTTLLAIAALGVAIVTLVWVIRDRRDQAGDPFSSARYAGLERRVAQLGQRLEVLEEDVDSGRNAPLVTSGDPVEGVIRRSGAAISHIGLVRFDAFEDAGGAQSFALALIDDDGDGIVLSSLHSRHSTRLYVKDIRGGVADAPMSAEEEQALREAGLVP